MSFGYAFFLFRTFLFFALVLTRRNHALPQVREPLQCGTGKSLLFFSMKIPDPLPAHKRHILQKIPVLQNCC